MTTIRLVQAGRLWCYQARMEATLLEERVYAGEAPPGPDTPYTVTAWRCVLRLECAAKGLDCRLAQPNALQPA